MKISTPTSTPSSVARFGITEPQDLGTW
ncbi:hypothetical protein EYZ11_009591 [Aspergillus tanneri]|uniref:Uncharacterized protein n=1 Tax=Aspergillus tanneri TaxID=1220188 RepID=A0A4S3JCX0_9EURO|nr:hypothetical protein EYZ11_009591 [Aspergillus tanneri]